MAVTIMMNNYVDDDARDDHGMMTVMCAMSAITMREEDVPVASLLGFWSCGFPVAPVSASAHGFSTVISGSVALSRTIPHP